VLLTFSFFSNTFTKFRFSLLEKSYLINTDNCNFINLREKQMNNLSSQDIEKYSLIWTIISVHGKFLGAMYRNVIGTKEKNFGPLLEVETTIFLIYKTCQFISKYEEDNTILKLQELSFDKLVDENQSLFSHMTTLKGISDRISNYMTSQNDFEVLFLNLGNTVLQTKFEKSYPVRIIGVMEMIQNKKDFLAYFSSLINDSIKPTFDSLYRDGQSFMNLPPEEISKRITLETSSRTNTNYKTREEIQKKEGCYIATAVYGSYNHDKVLILRKFRDETLQPLLIGRFIIKFYYLLSPSLSIYFRKGIMNSLSRKFLDKIIKIIN